MHYRKLHSINENIITVTLFYTVLRNSALIIKLEIKSVSREG